MSVKERADMRLRDRAVTVVGSLMAAVLLSAAWVMPVLAQDTDGDGGGFDGDELGVPLAVAAVVIVGGVTYWGVRRARSRQGSQ
jgi:hypothetical protein